MSVDLCDLAENPAQSWKQCGVHVSPYPCTCDTYVKYGVPGGCGCVQFLVFFALVLKCVILAG